MIADDTGLERALGHALAMIEVLREKVRRSCTFPSAEALYGLEEGIAEGLREEGAAFDQATIDRLRLSAITTARRMVRDG
ncbi:hypothetical protein CHELA1G11_10608 [Hyphomicrobiales bacterium]|nr:hypothetical protein CHELA1G11_10608 [Hyphomicrobiales bacterium]CAH1673477.1 hypothetical protein CHELA1G2_13695 [Hyphomicrobiales bacterium]